MRVSAQEPVQKNSTQRKHRGDHMRDNTKRRGVLQEQAEPMCFRQASAHKHTSLYTDNMVELCIRARLSLIKQARVQLSYLSPANSV